MSWKIVFTKHAEKDAKKILSAGLKNQAEKLLAVLLENPFMPFPPFEKLVGDLKGSYSRRINIQHRIIYQVFEKEHTVKILRMWSHYQ